MPTIRISVSWNLRALSADFVRREKRGKILPGSFNGLRAGRVFFGPRRVGFFSGLTRWGFFRAYVYARGGEPHAGAREGGGGSLKYDEPAGRA